MNTMFNLTDIYADYREWDYLLSRPELCYTAVLSRDR